MAPPCFVWTSPLLFFFPEPHTVRHPPTCSVSSLLLTAPLLACLVHFGSHSYHFLLSVAPGHFTGDASTHWVSPSSSAQTFDPSDPAFYHLLSAAWFLLKWIIFLALQEVLISLGFRSYSLWNRHSCASANKNLQEVYLPPWTVLEYGSHGVPGLLDPQLALSLPVSYYHRCCYCMVFQQLSAAAFTEAIKWISLRQFCIRSESN